MKLKQSDEFIVGGYIPGPRGIDQQAASTGKPSNMSNRWTTVCSGNSTQGFRRNQAI
jgi:hypothetical protein